MQLKHIYITLVIIALVFQACVKEDLSKVNTDNYIWQGNVSLPVSGVTLTADDFAGGSVFNGALITYKVSFDFEEMFPEDFYDLDSLILRFNVINSFPAELQISPVFLKEGGGSSGFVFEDPHLIVEKPELDTTSFIINEPVELIHDEPFYEDEIPSLIESKEILLWIVIRDFDNRSEIMDQIDSYFISINVGIRSALKDPVN